MPDEWGRPDTRAERIELPPSPEFPRGLTGVRIVHDGPCVFAGPDRQCSCGRLELGIIGE